MGKKKDVINYQDLGHYLECAAGLADALNGELYYEGGKQFANAAYGISLLLRYIKAEVDEAAALEVTETYNRIKQEVKLEELRLETRPFETDIPPLQDR